MTVSVTTQCRFCGKVHIMQVDQEGYDRWRAGTLIQRALPSLSHEDRERLISGTCPICWDNIFGEEE
jgi:hypothetical protein